MAKRRKQHSAPLKAATNQAVRRAPDERRYPAQFRRRNKPQLNKGEVLLRLREFLLFAIKGKVRKKQLEEQTNQAACLNLVTNAVVAWYAV